MIDFQNPPDGCFVHRTQTHFDELDPLGILHHARFLRHLERAQQAFFDAVMDAKAFDTERYPDLVAVVRRIDIDYRRPIDGVFPFLIALRVDRVREAALEVGFEFRSDDGSRVFATGRRITCRVNPVTRQPCGWSGTFRTRFEARAKAVQVLPALGAV